MMTAIYLVTQHVRLRGGEGGEEGGGGCILLTKKYCIILKAVLNTWYIINSLCQLC